MPYSHGDKRLLQMQINARIRSVHERQATRNFNMSTKLGRKGRSNLHLIGTGFRENT